LAVGPALAWRKEWAHENAARSRMVTVKGPRLSQGNHREKNHEHFTARLYL
jgi:hypothetical protein